MSVNETVKISLREAIERRRADPAFMGRLAAIMERDRELLDRLAQ